MAEDQDVRDKVSRIRESVSGYREAQIYITFAQLGIGPALTSGPLTLDQLASATGTERRALYRFLLAAVAFDLVQQTEPDAFALTETGHAAFAPESDDSIGNLLRLESAFYQRWGRLTQAVQTGGRPPENRAQEEDPGWVRMFTLALLDNARRIAPALARAIEQILPADGQEPIRIIDIGGGHGAHALEIASRCPSVEAVVFDLPPVIDVTRDIVEQSGLGDRVHAVAGDFHSDQLGENYDVALLFGVLHGESPEGAESLLDAIYAALSPGGVLLIRSQGQSRPAVESGERELFDLHLLLSTEGGEVRPQRDTAELATSRGFEAKAPVNIPEPGSGQLLVFQKPS